MEIKSYIILAIASLILFILATSAMVVAIGLLCRETYKEAVAAYTWVREGAISLRDYWVFAKTIGAF